MTKYILQSGNVKDFPEKMKKYNEEVFRDFIEDSKEGARRGRTSSSTNPASRSGLHRGTTSANAPVKVLFNFFSQKREDWEMKHNNYDKRLRADVDLKLETKMAMPDKFAEQCRWADVIIFAGGDDDLLRCRMSKFDVPGIWEGKVVTGGSAGASHLVNSFWTCDWRKIMNGKGVIPVKFIAHFRSNFGDDDPRGPIDWDKAYKELEDYGDKGLPIYALEEGDFVVLTK